TVLSPPEVKTRSPSRFPEIVLVDPPYVITYGTELAVPSVNLKEHPCPFVAVRYVPVPTIRYLSPGATLRSLMAGILVEGASTCPSMFPPAGSVQSESAEKDANDALDVRVQEQFDTPGQVTAPTKTA